MPFASINDIEMYYEVHGSGPPVVFAHGSGGNHLSWWKQMPFFSQYYTCVTFDHRTFGRTSDSEEPQGRRAFADDLKALIDHLDMEKVAIVAHSMGARTGFGLTVRYPERVWGVVFSGSNAGSVNDESRRIAAERRKQNENLPPGTIKALSARFVEENPEEAFLYRQVMRLNQRHAPDFLAVPPGYRGSTHDRLTESGVPILYIVGEDDTMVDPRTVEIAASQVPQAQLVKMPNAGHSVYYEQPELFNQTVLEFLRKVVPCETGK